MKDEKGEDDEKNVNTVSVNQTCLNLPRYVLLAWEKSFAAKDIINSVPVALLFFLAANNILGFSFSTVLIKPKQKLLKYHFKNFNKIDQQIMKGGKFRKIKPILPMGLTR